MGFRRTYSAETETLGTHRLTIGPAAIDHTPLPPRPGVRIQSIPLPDFFHPLAPTLHSPLFPPSTSLWVSVWRAFSSPFVSGLLQISGPHGQSLLCP